MPGLVGSGTPCILETIFVHSRVILENTSIPNACGACRTNNKQESIVSYGKGLNTK